MINEDIKKYKVKISYPMRVPPKMKEDIRKIKAKWMERGFSEKEISDSTVTNKLTNSKEWADMIKKELGVIRKEFDLRV